MPEIGERSAHDCPECGLPMYWSEAAVPGRHPSLPTAPPWASKVAYIDAYRCANGHTSQECPLCGSYDTAAWIDRDDLPHFHIICGTCGNDSIVSK
jgi:hypothetical protein